MLNFDKSKKLYYISQGCVNCVYQFHVSVLNNLIFYSTVTEKLSWFPQIPPNLIVTNCPEIC